LGKCQDSWGSGELRGGRGVTHIPRPVTLPLGLSRHAAHKQVEHFCAMIEVGGSNKHSKKVIFLSQECGYEKISNINAMSSNL